MFVQIDEGLCSGRVSPATSVPNTDLGIMRFGFVLAGTLANDVRKHGVMSRAQLRRVEGEPELPCQKS